MMKSAFMIMRACLVSYPLMFGIFVGAEKLVDEAELNKLTAVQEQMIAAVQAFQPKTLLYVYSHALLDEPPMDIKLPDRGPLADKTTTTAPHLHYWAASWPGWVKLFPAAADTVWALVQVGSWLGVVVLIGELILGFIVTAILVALCDPKNRMSDNLVLIVVPVGSIVLGSLAAWALKFPVEWILGGTAAFTHYGALCLAAGGASAAIYTGGVKVAEIIAHGAMEA